MIHLETLLDSSFRSIGILRIYDGVPQDQPAFDLRLDFDYSATLIWHPAKNTATLKALTAATSNAPWSLNQSRELAEFIYIHTGATSISWERASGKKHMLHREGPFLWRLVLRKNPQDACISQ